MTLEYIVMNHVAARDYSAPVITNTKITKMSTGCDAVTTGRYPRVLQDRRRYSVTRFWRICAYHQMTSLDRIPAVTETDAISTQRDGINFGRRKVEDDTAVFA